MLPGSWPNEEIATADRHARLSLIVVAAVLFALGAGVRIWWWWTRGDLWGDEAAFASNLLESSWSRLGRPFTRLQVAPIAFASIEKLSIELFGVSERVLRFFPLLTGIALLVMLPALCRRLFSWRAALVCLALLVPASDPIYFAAELKPYSSDAVISTALVWIAIASWEGSVSRWLLVVAGVVAPWWSIPAPLLLAPIGIAFAWRDLTRCRVARRGLVDLAVMGAAWLASFAVHYWLFLGDFASNQGHVDYFRDSGGLPEAQGSALDLLRFYLRTVINSFESPFGLGFRWAAAALFALGLVRSHRQKPLLVWLCIGAWATTILCSIFDKYPVQPRMLMVLAPLAIAPVAVGIAWLLECASRAPKAAAIALTCVLVAPSAAEQAKQLQRAPAKVATSDLVSHLGKHARPGDTVAVEYGSMRVFDYYARDLPNLRVVYFTAQGSKSFARNALDGLPRVWVLSPSLSRYGPRSAKAVPIIVRIERNTKEWLDRHGRPLESISGSSSTLYLYDLR